MDKKTIVVGIVAFVGMGLIQFVMPKKIKELWKDSTIEAIYCLIILILSLAAIASNTYNPFIYFQF